MKKATEQKQIAEVEYFLKRKWYAKVEEFLQHHRLVGYTMTAGRIKEEYGVTKKQLEKKKIHFIQLKNPHYSCAGNMKCYIKQEVEDKFSIKAIRRKKMIEVNVDVLTN